MTTSKILFISDASREAFRSISGLLRVVQKIQPSVRAIFLSFLSTFPEQDCGPLGPNTLFLLIQEEKEVLELTKSLFAGMNIPYRLDFITMPNWQPLVDETENGEHHLIILQGKAQNIWSERRLDFGMPTYTMDRPKSPVVLINEAEKAFPF